MSCVRSHRAEENPLSQRSNGPIELTDQCSDLQGPARAAGFVSHTIRDISVVLLAPRTEGGRGGRGGRRGGGWYIIAQYDERRGL
eukprot:COSAG02_NODE_432_length_22440_cov_53.821315_7_plen_85_part_00